MDPPADLTTGSNVSVCQWTSISQSESGRVYAVSVFTLPYGEPELVVFDHATKDFIYFGAECAQHQKRIWTTIWHSAKRAGAISIPVYSTEFRSNVFRGLLLDHQCR